MCTPNNKHNFKDKLVAKEYDKFLEYQSDKQLLEMAKERMNNKSRLLTEEEFNERNGINEHFLNNTVEVELE